MAAGQLMIVQISWTAFLKIFSVYLVLGLLLAYIWHYRPPYSFFFSLAFLLLFVCAVVAKLFPPHFRRARRAYGKNNPDKAIAEMEGCLAFFQRHPWIDRHRWIATLNYSAISYREMALLNIAMFHTSAGRKEEAKEAYRWALDLFPESVAATRALKAIETFEAPTPA